MSTAIKIAIAVVIIIGLAYLIKKVSTRQSEPKPRQKTVYDQFEEDDRKLRSEPWEEQQSAKSSGESAEEATQKNEAVTYYFSELTEEQEVDAQRLFEYALTQRKIARLPGPGFKPMVDACRQIIQRYPGSKYAYKARRILGEVPRRLWSRYNITVQEVSLERYKQK